MVDIDNIHDKDLVELGELFEELIPEESNISKMKDTLRNIEKDSNYYLMGVKEGNKLVGTCSGIICKDISGDCTPFMVIENVIVHKDYRRKGVGTVLIKHMENIAIHNKCRYIIFVSGMQREEAHKFYNTLGYRLDEVRGFKKYTNCIV